jgi:endonuclease/exonuclease/phosphatase family metal-dependent hydrolase
MTTHQNLITVMTQNVYFGLEAGAILGASDPADLIAAITRAWEQVQSTNIPERAEYTARQIALAKPDLVGLQEVAQFFLIASGRVTIKFDFLESIILALAKLGLFYVPLAVRNDLDRTGPLDTNGTLIRMVDRHAVLLRIGEGAREVRAYSVRNEAFLTLFQASSLIVGQVAVPRSWIAVDAMLGGSKFRLIETHLESFSGDVQVAQVEEILAGPAIADFPVIMIGDFNSNPLANSKDSSPTYPAVIAAGFQDVWPALLADTPGDTCCQQPALLNTNSELNRRLDFIFTRGDAKPVRVDIVGWRPADRTPSGLWPSDHAGLVATIAL